MPKGKRSVDPKAPEAVVVYTKRRAAVSQLETAITLWFSYGDPISIHSLAAAANEVFHGMGRLRRMPTIIQEWKKPLTKAKQKQVTRVQNFAKHAHTDSDPDARVPVVTEYAELLILDSIMCHAKLFGSYTPMMRCFHGRFVLESPDIQTFISPQSRAELKEALPVYAADKISRSDFFKQFYGVFVDGA